MEQDKRRYPSDQENFWSGEFGDNYSDRNTGPGWVSSNTAFFATALESVPYLNSVFEIGPNIGLNLAALRALYPNMSQAGVEINEHAAAKLEDQGVRVHRDSVTNHTVVDQADLSLSKGVLIHIKPELLPRAYDVLHRATRRYILIAEYYSPRPESILYRGEADRLFRRDFAGELMDAHPDVELLRTGFAYHRGPFPQDDLTWFLMEKKSR